MTEPAWHEPWSSSSEQRPPSTLRKVTTFKVIHKSEYLPAISTTNVRSLGPKIKNYIQDFKQRELALSIVTETWGRDDKKPYIKKIVAMFETEGLGSFSLNRKARRGGGVAVVYDSQALMMEQIEVIVPHNLEVIWCLARPKMGQVRVIIVAAFYYPPRAKKKVKMTEHLITTCHTLLLKHPGAELVIAGD